MSYKTSIPKRRDDQKNLPSSEVVYPTMRFLSYFTSTEEDVQLPSVLQDICDTFQTEDERAEYVEGFDNLRNSFPEIKQEDNVNVLLRIANQSLMFLSSPHSNRDDDVKITPGFVGQIPHTDFVTYLLPLIFDDIQELRSDLMKAYSKDPKKTLSLHHVVNYLRFANMATLSWTTNNRPTVGQVYANKREDMNIHELCIATTHPGDVPGDITVDSIYGWGPVEVMSGKSSVTIEMLNSYTDPYTKTRSYRGGIALQLPNSNSSRFDVALPATLLRPSTAIIPDPSLFLTLEKASHQSIKVQRPKGPGVRITPGAHSLLNPDALSPQIPEGSKVVRASKFQRRQPANKDLPPPPPQPASGSADEVPQ